MSSNNTSSRYKALDRPMDNDFLDGTPPVIEASDSEIRDLMKKQRSDFARKLLVLWYEAYATENKQVDMQKAIAVLANDVQNLDILLRLTAPAEERKKNGGYT